VRIFLGITGASGAPYAVRLLQALVAADCEVGVCASGAGIEVIGTEVYGDPTLPRDEVLARMTEGAGDAVTVYDPVDWSSPYASGSAKVDGYVVCPCSMSTLATIASGAMQNLVHRAASVAMKEERKLVLMPRETPLSTIHLETMLTAKRAGLLPRGRVGRRPGRFRRRARARPARRRQRADQALGGLTLALSIQGQEGPNETMATGTLPPEGVRTMFDRIAPVYDVMNRVMTAGLDQRWRRKTVEAVVEPGDRTLDAACGTGDLALIASKAGATVTGLDFSEAMLQRARRKSSDVEWIRGDLLALPFDDDTFDSATVGFGIRNVADLPGSLEELRRVLRPGGRLGILEITRPRGPLRVFYSLWFDRIVPLLGKVLPGGEAYTYLPASVRRFPGPDDLAAQMAGFTQVEYRLFAGGIVALHTGVKE
jgi:demethylmenaquinone methyltransferase/2-methoxy-6-polyprenyl-1,4-benzoquinol methylase